MGFGKSFRDAFGLENAEEKKSRLAEERQEKQEAQGEYADEEPEKPTSEDAQTEQQERVWTDVNEPFKFVCKGGKVKCKYHSEAVEIMPTSTQVMLQDQPYATTGDKNGKVNFDFKGQCMHPKWGKDKPPCKTVIQLGEWEDFSNTNIDNYNALLVKSTIPCSISGENLIITFSGQKAELTDVEISRRPRVVKMYWIDEKGNKISTVNLESGKAFLRIETRNFDQKSISVELEYDEDYKFSNGEKCIIMQGTIDENGIAILTPNNKDVLFNKIE